jgi:hypothetical protein
MSEPAQVTIQQAYEEACLALGEATVQQRLMAKAASTQIEALTKQVAALTPSEPEPRP